MKMKLYDPERMRFTAILVAALGVAAYVALSTRSEAMRPQDWGAGDCWNLGPGHPGASQIEPVCIQLNSGPDCYICLYNPPGPRYGACAEYPDGSEPECFICNITGTPPECPSYPG